ncbi:MAG: dTMP kinase [bacterium]
MGRGLLIDFEGIDGAGKSTQAEMTFGYLSSRGIPVRLLREPTKGQHGRMIREILSGRAPRGTPEEELDLFIRDRMEDVRENIEPALSSGLVVLIDRYYYSTMAYQGALGLDVEMIRRRNESFAPRPDLVLIFLIAVEEGLARIRAERQKGTDGYEKESFLSTVDEIFRSFNGSNIRFIDSQRPLNEVQEEVRVHVDSLLREKGHC